MSKTRLASCALVSALAASGCSIDVQGNAAVIDEERRFQAGEGTELTLRTFDGAIDVQSWDQNEIVVRIQRTASTADEAKGLEVRTTQEGNRIVIEAPRPAGDDIVRVGPGRSVAFAVRVPRRTALDARSGDGAVTLSGLDGAITVETGDGSVRAERIAGQVRLRTGDGSITVSDASGAVDVNTGDGSIDLRGRLEGLRVHTGDGSVHVEVDEGSVLRADWSVTTGDGAIRLQLPSTLDADIEAESGDGRIRADWVQDQPRRDDDDRQSFRARLGNGGRVIRLQSGDGSIDISRR